MSCGRAPGIVRGGRSLTLAWAGASALLVYMAIEGWHCLRWILGHSQDSLLLKLPASGRVCAGPEGEMQLGTRVTVCPGAAEWRKLIRLRVLEVA